MAKGILERLSEGIVLGDGGFVLEMEKRGYVQAGPFTPEVVIEYPQAVKELHFEFLKAGAEVLQAFAFYATKDKLATVGFADKTLEINRTAVRLAREVAGDKALVSGNLSTTWDYVEEDPKSHDVVREQFQEQLDAQMEEGIDFIIAELFYDLGEALIALKTAKATGLPIMVTMSFTIKPLTRDGKSPAECAKTLMDEGADIVGINCSRGPKHMLPLIREMREAVDGYVAVQPVGFRTTDEMPTAGGLPGFPYAMEPYQLTRFEMADYAKQAKEVGINYIGACCGTIATHIREMARVLGKLAAEEKVWQPNYERPMSVTEEFKEVRERQ